MEGTLIATLREELKRDTSMDARILTQLSNIMRDDKTIEGQPDPSTTRAFLNRVVGQPRQAAEAWTELEGDIHNLHGFPRTEKL